MERLRQTKQEEQFDMALAEARAEDQSRNALIAAAPDLLVIAEWVKAAVEGNERNINNDLYNAACEAIAKAKGQ